jgi:hypothetical protein
MLGLQPGTLGCVFRHTNFSNGQRPFISLEEFGKRLPPETTSPYDRLRHALRSGKLRSTFVRRSHQGAVSDTDCRPEEWFDFDNLADPENERTARSSIASDPEECAVLVSREEAIRLEAELSAAEAERPVWKLEQALGWIAYRDQSFRSLGRIDLQPPTFLGQSYKRDFVEASPLAALTVEILSGKVLAYVRGVAQTRAECISLLSEKDGLWGNADVIFLPEEIRATWKRMAAGKKVAGTAKDQALEQLILILKEGKEQNIRTLRQHAQNWAEQRYGIKGKTFGAIWSRARGHPDVLRDVGGGRLRPNFRPLPLSSNPT